MKTHTLPQLTHLWDFFFFFGFVLGVKANYWEFPPSILVHLLSASKYHFPLWLLFHFHTFSSSLPFFIFLFFMLQLGFLLFLFIFSISVVSSGNPYFFIWVFINLHFLFLSPLSYPYLFVSCILQSTYDICLVSET